jgi:single-strand DNA-binding protein
MNKVILVGNAGMDPDAGTTTNGTAYARISLATNEKWKKDGVLQEKTSWHRIKFWGRQAEVVAQYVHKGSKLLVEGRIEYGEYEKDGVRVFTTEIVAQSVEFLSPKSPDAPAPKDDDVPF